MRCFLSCPVGTLGQTSHRVQIFGWLKLCHSYACLISDMIQHPLPVAIPNQILSCQLGLETTTAQFWGTVALLGCQRYLLRVVCRGTLHIVCRAGEIMYLYIAGAGEGGA